MGCRGPGRRNPPRRARVRPACYGPAPVRGGSAPGLASIPLSPDAYLSSSLKYLPVSPCPQAGLRVRQGRERPDRAGGSRLRTDPQPDQLRALEDRQPRVEPARGWAPTGFIAQVWTGPRGRPTVYRGRARERTFETLPRIRVDMDVVRAGAGPCWFLNDRSRTTRPLLGRHYKANWESTLTASLLLAAGLAVRGHALARSDLSEELPDRRQGPRKARRSGWSRSPIPPSYATELQTSSPAERHGAGRGRLGVRTRGWAWSSPTR